MTPGGRAAAAIEILDRIIAGHPAEQALTNWARASRFAGSGDRAAIRDLVFDTLRRRRSASVLGGGMSGRALLIGLMRGRDEDPTTLFTGEGHAPEPLSAEEMVAQAPISATDRLDFPDWLLPELQRSLGDRTAEVAEILRLRAPVGLRVNWRKADHETADAALMLDDIESTAHALAGSARIATRNERRIKGSRAFQDGLVELQDPASQAVVEALLPVSDGARILDYCAGGGGKALALAAATGAAITAHDVSEARMRDIPNRASRAGVTLHCTTKPAGLWDLVLVDAPCSGSGSWRRQPEAKWSLTEARLLELTRLQADVLEKAAAFVDRGGRLAYATCSLLSLENQEQTQGFLTSHGGWELLSERTISPCEGGDGFYISQLLRH